jgi:hypothetical protein
MGIGQKEMFGFQVVMRVRVIWHSAFTALAITHFCKRVIIIILPGLQREVMLLFILTGKAFPRRITQHFLKL